MDTLPPLEKSLLCVLDVVLSACLRVQLDEPQGAERVRGGVAFLPFLHAVLHVAGSGVELPCSLRTDSAEVSSHLCIIHERHAQELSCNLCLPGLSELTPV
jgi:hypothetical protein